MTASPAKAAQPIVMPFRMLTWVGPRNHVLDRDPDPHTQKGNFEDKGGWSRTSYKYSYVITL